MLVIQMNIDNKRYKYPDGGMHILPQRRFSLAPYATAASGAALGFLAGGGVPGAIAGGKLGYELGSSSDPVGKGMEIAGEYLSNKRKR